MTQVFSPGDTIRFSQSTFDRDEYNIDFMDMSGVIVSYTYPDNERYQYPLDYGDFYNLGPVLIPSDIKPLFTESEATHLEQAFKFACFDVVNHIEMAEVLAMLWGEEMASEYLPYEDILAYDVITTEFKEAVTWLTEMSA